MSGFIIAGRNPNADTLDSLNSTAFALLAGRACGQVLQGGTAANEDLTLEGTAHGTKDTSYVILQPTTGNVGVGTTTPTLGRMQIDSGNASFCVLGNVNTASYPMAVYPTAAGSGRGIALFRRDSTATICASFEVTASSEMQISMTNAPIILTATGVGIGPTTVVPATPLHVVGAATITGGIRPAADSTTALTLCKANGDAVVTVDTTNGRLVMAEAANIEVGTTTGTKIGIGATGKLGFYGATPIVQPAGIAVTAEGIHAALVNLGLITA